MFPSNVKEEDATFQVSGRIRKVIFQRDGFMAAALDDETKVVGEMHAKPDLSRVYTFHGEWVTHVKFGQQFKFKSYDVEVPRGREAIGAYLKDTCSFVGPVRMVKILEVFGDEALDILKSDPERVAREIEGLSVSQATKIAADLKALASGEALDIGLRTLFSGVPKIGKFARKRIVDQWGEQACEVIKENPFLLTKIHGIGFLTADQVARKVGFAPDSPPRIRAAMLHVLGEATSDGNCFLPVDDMVQQAAKLAALPAEKVYKQIAPTVMDGELTMDGDDAYLPRIHAAERYVAKNLAERADIEADEVPGNVDGLAEDQVLATKILLGSQVALLTGPPGTGKTYALRRVVEAFKGQRVAVCAPTGKAARRLKELTGWDAMTIHRLLEPVPIGEGWKFTRGLANPIAQSVVVVDEVSMVPITLMASLLEAMPRDARLILTGDSDQLPSVGAGAVLRDLMASKVIPHARLHEIKRQAAGSKIIHACHAVRDGLPPLIENKEADDLFFMQQPNAQQLAALVVDLVYNRLPARYGVHPERGLVTSSEGRPLDPLVDIQVITAHRKHTDLSAEALNSAMQRRRMEAAKQDRNDKQRLYVGDKVMQTVNVFVDGDDGKVFVANGDIGTVLDVGDRLIVVEFESPKRVVSFPEIGNDLELAYAVTVHKFQGSQAPCIVIPVHGSTSPLLLQRSWVYTAVSRAEKLCVLAGQRAVLDMAIRRSEQDKRQTRLCELLRAEALG